MVDQLITLPLRVGARATQLWLRAVEQTVAVVADSAGRLIDIPDHHVRRGGRRP